MRDTFYSGSYKSGYEGDGPPIPDGAVLTQYGSAAVPDGQVFRSKPRHPREFELSMLLGDVGLDAAVKYVRKRAVEPNDRIRTTTAGKLRELGFRVIHTPSVRIPIHVSVTVPTGHVEWDDAQEFAFSSAFPPMDEGGAPWPR
jgi:hypothetical protein